MIKSLRKNNARLTRIAAFLAGFIAGGAGYCFLEVLWRGHSHYSMFIAGGICFLMLLRLSKSRMHPIAKCAAAGMMICAVEFVTGCVFNLWLGKNVWDYSSQRFNILGQVCPQYFFLWCALSAAVFMVIALLPPLPPYAGPRD